MPFPHFKHLGSAPGLKVKKAAHEHVAKLLSWSMGWAAAGLWPPVGFHKEVLDPKSLRGKMVNQELANGWRTLFLWFAMVIVYSKLTYNHPSQPFHNHIYIHNGDLFVLFVFVNSTFKFKNIFIDVPLKDGLLGIQV